MSKNNKNLSFWRIFSLFLSKSVSKNFSQRNSWKFLQFFGIFYKIRNFFATMTENVEKTQRKEIEEFPENSKKKKFSFWFLRIFPNSRTAHRVLQLRESDEKLPSELAQRSGGNKFFTTFIHDWRIWSNLKTSKCKNFLNPWGNFSSEGYKWFGVLKFSSLRDLVFHIPH